MRAALKTHWLVSLTHSLSHYCTKNKKQPSFGVEREQEKVISSPEIPLHHTEADPGVLLNPGLRQHGVFCKLLTACACNRWITVLKEQPASPDSGRVKHWRGKALKPYYKYNSGNKGAPGKGRCPVGDCSACIRLAMPTRWQHVHTAKRKEMVK